MNGSPLVSVAIITYNHKEFLREAIESVLLQNYKPIEIVVGDDCSTDGTQEMLQQYNLSYPGIFKLRLANKNAGITHNSNAVHAACTGKYIAWLGGDDLMLPGKIASQVAFLETHEACNIVYHNLEVFDSSSGKKLKLFNSASNAHTGDVRKLIKYGTFNGACATMVRRAASPAHGFDERIMVASDWLYWIEHLEKGGLICYIDKILGKYRKHRSNVTGQNSQFAKQGHLDGIRTADILEEKFPQFKNIIRYRKAVLYRGMRTMDYRYYLKMSLSCHPFSIKTLLLLFINTISFGKLKP